MKTDKSLTDFSRDTMKNVTQVPKPKCPLREPVRQEFSGLSKTNSCFTEQPVGFYFIVIGKTDLKKIFLFALAARKLRTRSAVPPKQTI